MITYYKYLKISAKSLIAFACFFIYTIGFAQNLSLNDAILLSLRYNPNVKNAQIERTIQKFNLRTAQNNFELQYALSGSYNKNFGTTNGQNSFSNLTPSVSKNGVYGTQTTLQMINPSTNGVYNPGIQLTVTQPLLKGFGKKVATASLYTAEQQENVNKLNLRNTIMSTIVSVINAYRSVIADQNNVLIAQKALESFQKTIDLDKALIDAGRIAPTEIVKAQADLASAKVNLQNAMNTVTSDKLALLNIIGLPADSVIEIPTDIPLNAEHPPTQTQAFNIALQNNITYLISKINLQIDDRNLIVAKDNTRTQLDLAVNAQTVNTDTTTDINGFQNIITNTPQTSVQLNLNVPINNYPLKQAVVAAKVQKEQDEVNFENLQRELLITLNDELNNIASNAKQIELSDTALKLQEQNQDMLLAKLQYGLVSTFEVTTNQQNLNNARAQVVQSKINYLNALTQLQADMGTLLEQWHIEVRY